MNHNLHPRAVQLESGWVAQVVLFRSDPMLNPKSQPAPDVVWESDEAFETWETAEGLAQEALLDGVRQLFKGVQR